IFFYAEKDVGIKDVGNKGLSQCIKTETKKKEKIGEVCRLPPLLCVADALPRCRLPPYRIQFKHELAEKKGKAVNRVELFRKTHVRAGMFGRRPQRMRIIKYWNSNPSLPQSVVSHSLRMGYAIKC
uniref:Uncharacterized protein n=1 Tax=Cucumis melo TaxID=3656 RepID=A0A9I9EB94_CUCME